ncbi:hypothetical protein AGABI2DRAFT_201345 [Agaricus bisporus var. bisporus H97]|uniref:hypothetical protein n=1 Tax=Agaricus bisporus var. bisporus (strain H97 / ATCC MYA-4626 / FGSC 10389) TaxID=936046 RepID=UPI00029F70E6|nr:hypothetical protein AGABI2DRAFT_201345 [Agaricus bisporus var. bisporus H97]EKV49198.1 hypothetical protein AGABI2DRAFT_201345 [Agaricus bisporus var. bisporus H97]
MPPNFPQNLSIAPSAHPSVKLSPHFSHNAQCEAITQYGIAGRVWESAYLTSLYVDPLPNLEFDLPFPGVSSPLTIIELGSGTGIVAAAIAQVLDAQRDLVVATDLPDVCPLLEKNLSAVPATLVRPLTWGNNEHLRRISSELSSMSDPRKLTHIICSDLIYFPELLAPLLRCLLHLTSESFVQNSSPPVVIISYKIRSLIKESPFWSAFGLWFDFQPILARAILIPKTTQERAEVVETQWYRFGADEENMFIFVAHRKPESVGWQIPTKDHDLLNGVYAGGSSETKHDDTFESLLLLSLQ